MGLADLSEQERSTRFVIRPNSSLSWHDNQLFFLSMCGLSFGIAGVFAWFGFWMVLPFAGLEMLLLGAGLYICSRRACRREVVSVAEDTVEVAVGRDKPEQRWAFNRYWVQVVLSQSTIRGYPSRLTLRAEGREVEVGACLNNDERDNLAGALRAAIQR